MSCVGHIAVRMCMGCGERGPQQDLLRIASQPDGTLGIVRAHPRGRTGYLHVRPACWDRFAARKGPVRSLGRQIDKTIRLSLVDRLKRDWSPITR